MYCVKAAARLRGKFGNCETADCADDADKGNDKNRRKRLSADEDSKQKITKETKIMFCPSWSLRYLLLKGLCGAVSCHAL